MAKSIMVQGTASSVGKSIITAGLCRVLMQDGYKVAPFKSQNMALNSFITEDGKEMGRAQVVQAEAAGIEPSVEMNPVLLKPTTDKKSQVILNGEVYKNMSAVEYHNFKPELTGMVREIYSSLASKHDCIVIEGAGSPAEINLRDKDFVNMGMAEIADAPVILVGDIDRGGVFAALAGTMLLLTESERRRVKGVIINKFRGDIEILKPGLQMLEDIIHIPVLGVLPYTKLDIDDEDSLTEKFTQKKKGNKEEIDVAIIKLPHISNFTDFNALEQTEGVRVRYVERPEDLQEPDLILLPGSKNSMEDLMHIRKNGIEAEIKKLHQKGTCVFGICGGFQMLGREIHDPFCLESDLLKLDGLGLLDTKTVFQQKKVTTQVNGIISEDNGLLDGLKGADIKGYEIHMGETEQLGECVPYLTIHKSSEGNSQWVGGVRNIAGNVFGTYIHGIFDNTAFTTRFINNMRKAKGMEQIREYEKSYKEYKEQQYDKLADMLRENLDMKTIYKIMEL